MTAGRCTSETTAVNAPGLAAIVLEEVSPTHDPDGALLDRYLDALAAAFV